MADVDVLVIGSGAGGLTAAVALARAGKKVVVLEQHDVPGGWCHSFRLGGHQFSPGVHYIGELGEGGKLREVYEGLGVANGMTFLELNPDGFEHVQIGAERFDIPKGREAFARRLKERFPKEAKGIDGYLAAVAGISHELNEVLPSQKGLLGTVTLPFRAPNLLRWGLGSAQRMIRGFVDDPVLQAILGVQAGDHGLGPADVPAAVHAGVQAHYFDGGWYPKGGGGAIPRAFVAELKRNGGEIRLKTRVEKLLTESVGGRRRILGARLADGTEIRASIVISNADPGVTYGRLLAPEEVPAKAAEMLARTKWSISALSLFLAVDMDLRAAGYDSGNYWYNRTPDVQGSYSLAASGRLDVDELPGQFATITTLKDPSKGLGNIHTLESFCFVSFDAFRAWAHTHFGQRPEDYQRLKVDLSAKLIRGLDRIMPGTADRVVFQDLGTPLTNVHYVEATEGNLYGTAKTLKQIGPWAFRIRSGIDGLYLCGASTTSHGVMGATTSGMFAAASALGCRARELLTATGQSLRTLPCDDLDAWPEDLRSRIALKRAAGAAARPEDPAPPAGPA